MKVLWFPQAERDLDHVLEFIRRDSPSAAMLVADRIEHAIQRILLFPLSGRRGRLTGTRELVVPDTPFIIPYLVAEDTIVILAVMHGAQKWPEKP